VGQIITIGFASGALLGLLAIGIVLVYKASRVLNFAQAEIGNFATYIAWFLIIDFGLPWAVGGFLALAAAGAIGFVFERFIVRPMLNGPKLAIAVATLGLMSLLGFIESEWEPRFIRPPISGRGPEIFGIFVSPTRLLAFFSAIALGAALYWFVKRTTFGLGLLASAHDPVAVRLMGIRMKHLSLFTWVTASLLGGLAGLLALSATGNFGAFSMTFSFLVPALAAALLGGMTSLPGAFAGGMLIGVLQTALSFNFGSIPGVEQLGAFAVLIAVLVLRPQGLFGKVA